MNVSVRNRFYQKLLLKMVRKNINESFWQKNTDQVFVFEHPTNFFETSSDLVREEVFVYTPPLPHTLLPAIHFWSKTPFLQLFVKIITGSRNPPDPANISQQHSLYYRKSKFLFWRPYKHLPAFGQLMDLGRRQK